MRSKRGEATSTHTALLTYPLSIHTLVVRGRGSQTPENLNPNHKYFMCMFTLSRTRPPKRFYRWDQFLFFLIFAFSFFKFTISFLCVDPFCFDFQFFPFFQFFFSIFPFSFFIFLFCFSVFLFCFSVFLCHCETSTEGDGGCDECPEIFKSHHTNEALGHTNIYLHQLIVWQLSHLSEGRGLTVFQLHP